MKQIAILASGSGSNAEIIANYFASSKDIKVACIISNKADAGVLARAERLGIPHYHFNNQAMKEGREVVELLEKLEVEAVILAGYLLLITPIWLEKFPNRIINIHPALLPNYGGKGMYGDNVHRAVLQNKEAYSGITIHLVNAEYDKGQTLLQASCSVRPEDTVESLANRIHSLEHRFFAPTIEQYLLCELHFAH